MLFLTPTLFIQQKCILFLDVRLCSTKLRYSSEQNMISPYMHSSYALEEEPVSTQNYT